MTQQGSDTAPQTAHDAAEKHTWFSAVTAWRAGHFIDASPLPYALLSGFGILLIAAAFTELVGSFNRLVAIIGLIALALGARVLIGQVLARFRSEPFSD